MTSEKKAPPKVSIASQAKNFFIGGISGMTATCFVNNITFTYEVFSTCRFNQLTWLKSEFNLRVNLSQETWVL